MKAPFFCVSTYSEKKSQTMQCCTELQLQVPYCASGKGPLVDLERAPYITNGLVIRYTYSGNGNILVVLCDAVEPLPNETIQRPYLFVFARELSSCSKQRPDAWRYIQTIHLNSALITETANGFGVFNMFLSFDGQRLTVFASIFPIDDTIEPVSVVAKVFDYSCGASRFIDTHSDTERFYPNSNSDYANLYQMSGYGQTIVTWSRDTKEEGPTLLRVHRVDSLKVCVSKKLRLFGKIDRPNIIAVALSYDGLTIVVFHTESGSTVMAVYRVNLQNCQLELINAESVAGVSPFEHIPIFGGAGDSILYVQNSADNQLYAFCKNCETGTFNLENSGAVTVTSNSYQILSVCDDESSIVALDQQNNLFCYTFDCATKTFTLKPLPEGNENCTVPFTQYEENFRSLALSVICSHNGSAAGGGGWCVLVLFNAKPQLYGSAVIYIKHSGCGNMYCLAGGNNSPPCKIEIFKKGGYSPISIGDCFTFCVDDTPETVRFQLTCDDMSPPVILDVALSNRYLSRCIVWPQQCLSKSCAVSKRHCAV